MSLDITEITFLNTRPKAQATSLEVVLGEFGVKVIDLPCLEIVSSVDSKLLLSALDDPDSWVIFTSANGVRSVEEFPGLAKVLRTRKIAAIGEQTREVLDKQGFSVQFSPKVQNSKGFACEFPSFAGSLVRRVILLRGDRANSGLPTSLKEAGLAVEDLVVYRSLAPRYELAVLREKLSILATCPSCVILLSGLAAENLQSYAKKVNLWQEIAKIPTAAIGPVTGLRLKELGFNLILEASSPEIKLLVSELMAKLAIADYSNTRYA